METKIDAALRLSAMLGVIHPSADCINADEVGVFMEIFPSPRSYSEWETIKQSLINCGIDYVIPHKYRCNSTMHEVPLNTCFFFKIPREKFLFLSGEKFQAGMCGPMRKKYSVFTRETSNYLGTVVDGDNGKGNDKYAAEIKLTICAPSSYSELVEEVRRRKQTKSRHCQKWQEIIARCFQPFKSVFKPVEHAVETSNVELRGVPLTDAKRNPKA